MSTGVIWNPAMPPTGWPEATSNPFARQAFARLSDEKGEPSVAGNGGAGVGDWAEVVGDWLEPPVAVA